MGHTGGIVDVGTGRVGSGHGARAKRPPSFWCPTVSARLIRLGSKNPIQLVPLVLVLTWLNIDVILRNGVRQSSHESCLGPCPVLLVHDELIASMSVRQSWIADCEVVPLWALWAASIS